MFGIRSIMAIMVALATLSVFSPPAQAQQGTKIGTLTCNLSPSIGFIIGSQQRMACRFIPDGPYPHFAELWRARMQVPVALSALVSAWAQTFFMAVRDARSRCSRSPSKGRLE